jgi:hypothetical protein
MSGLSSCRTDPEWIPMMIQRSTDLQEQTFLALDPVEGEPDPFLPNDDTSTALQLHILFCTNHQL